ncbi:MAG: NAD(P)-dependent glycerol-3-phosphate dehydrogenase [Acidobacteria bacterium]|nr:NAD(P)-dependent glycerol-3-phosphate dehydrogenase [Acidobacteriota bacterium]
MKNTAIAVIGAGSWGTALAQSLAGLNHDVRLWAYEKEVADDILAARENRTYLPGIKLLEAIRPTTDMAEAIDGVQYVLTVMPSHVCRSLYERMLPFLQPEMILVSATKGLEEKSLMRMSEVIQSVVEKRFSPRIAVLSGPSFAREVALGYPTAVVVASEDPEVAGTAQEKFSSSALCLYTSGDVVGVELGGAVKNVIAIAAGVIEGLGLGRNPMAALITRGLAEISRLGCACGARNETLSGLAGLGDLVLTCTGNLSRNLSVGIQLGKGRNLQEIMGSTNTVAEGVNTTGATVELAGVRNVEMPITQQVYRILQNEIAPRNAIRELMDRSLKNE